MIAGNWKLMWMKLGQRHFSPVPGQMCRTLPPSPQTHTSIHIQLSLNWTKMNPSTKVPEFYFCPGGAYLHVAYMLFLPQGRTQLRYEKAPHASVQEWGSESSETNAHSVDFKKPAPLSQDLSYLSLRLLLTIFFVRLHLKTYPSHCSRICHPKSKHHSPACKGSHELM